MNCDACGHEIEGEPWVMGGLILCPTPCDVKPEADREAEAERMAHERVLQTRPKSNLR